MASPARRFSSLSSLFSSPSRARRARPTPPKPKPKPEIKPAPIPKVPAGEARAQPKFLRDISRQRNPEKLVSQFISASAASPRFRECHCAYEKAVSRLLSFRRKDAVVELLDSQKPFLDASSEAFAARVVSLYGHASMPSHAAATFHHLPPKHKTVITFNALLTAYANSGDFDALTSAFQVIPASHPAIVPTVHSYNILIRGLCKKPDPSAALDAIGLMEKCGLTPDTISLKSLLYGFYKNGLFDDAEKVWEMMKERNVEPCTKCYTAKLRCLIAKGRIEDAIAVIERMQKDGPKPDTVSYNELIRWYCKEGRLDEAKKVYDDLAKNECAPNKGTFEALVPRFVEAGELDIALNFCHEIYSRKCNVKCSVLQQVVNALAVASRVKEAATCQDC